MKKRLKLTLLALTALLATLLLTFCSSNQTANDQNSAWSPTGESITLLEKSVPSEYVIVYPKGDDSAHTAALSFNDILQKNGLKTAGTVVLSDTMSTGKFEILFGAADRDVCRAAEEFLEKKSAATPYNLHCAFHYMDGRLAIVANSPRAYEMALDIFMHRYYSDGRIAFADTLTEHTSRDVDDYDDERLEQLLDDHEVLKAEHNAALPILLEKINDQRNELISSRFFGTSTKNIGKSPWGTAPTAPDSDHPRLLINNDTLPEVKRAFTRTDGTNVRLFGLFDDEIPNDCILPEPINKGTNTTVDLDNIHNFNETYLEMIQVKALAYLIYDDPYYGYQAIYYIKNYLKSLEIIQIASDQCRQYGAVMYTAAIVYDWCYPLLTDVDKEQIIAGVENRICRHYNKNGAAMEVGFPPSKQGSVSGHGSERQILRDYLSFATAIYNENSSWWDYVAARVYNDYVPLRNYYYQSGMVHQGTGYISGRYISDLFSAWILKVATGKNPYTGMAEVTKGLLGYEFSPGKLFNDGDGTGDQYAAPNYLSIVMIAAYLENDSALLAQAQYLYGNSMFTNSYNAMTSAAYAALRGLSDPTPAKSRYEGMSLIQYNGYPLGQYIIREAWGRDDSAAVFMRIKERTTANHEHCDSGTFEIYYKGMLTSDGGAYNNYGYAHTQYFHQATISHNGLIIYNPALAKTESGWYSGGQIKHGEASTLDKWLASSYDTGKVIGKSHAYIDDDPAKPHYAYIAGDITAAYNPSTVSHVERRMLTVFTGDEEFPMAFFVFDDITSVKSSYEKRFLLQISSSSAPSIDGGGKTVITKNGNGKLILKCLSENVKLNGVGGRSEGSYDASKSKNYLVNGVQLVPKSTSADDGHWGRVEIVFTKDATRATFLNVITVTDAENNDLPHFRGTGKNNGLEGAIFDEKIVALFATDRSQKRITLSCSTYGGDSMEYYVSGIPKGTWIVTVDGNMIGSFSADEKSDLLTFTAPAGNVAISPAN